MSVDDALVLVEVPVARGGSRGGSLGVDAFIEHFERSEAHKSPHLDG